MELNWVYFVPALLLLFYPTGDHGSSSRLRFCDYEDIRYNRGGSAEASWRQLWLWIDPLRAFAGAWLLRNAWVTVGPLEGAWIHVPLVATFALLALALGMQMHTRRDDTVLLAPMGYSIGLAFAILPPQIAALVIVSAVACTMGFRGWWAFYFFGAAAAAVFGYLILRVNLWMAGSVALLLEPLLLALMLKRSLAFPVTPRRKRVVVKRVKERSPTAKPEPEPELVA